MTPGREPGDTGPLVSIVVGNFNYARFLNAAIDSALGQTYRRVEVIVVDDGSSDNSREIIAAYGKRIVPVIKAEGGHASALNSGFRASHGDIVIFLDSDDMLLKEAAEEVVRAWRPGVAKVQFVLDQIDAQGRPLGIAVPYTPAAMPDGDLRERILSEGGYVTPPTSGNAFSRPALEQLMPLAESQWFLAANTSLEVLAPFFGDVVSIRRTLGLYRVHGANYGMLGTSLAPQKLRSKLVTDLQRENAIREFAARQNMPAPRSHASGDPDHLKYRLASIRLEPKLHPFLDDDRISLMAHGMSACWNSGRYNWRGKLFNSVWFPIAALMPISLARPILRMGIVPRSRPS
ncbi:MAG TPA: glycosyltransferase family A protein [Candidatus Binataceae bacterium]|nr:glycosyltransferase family A protein [Candidatus Binataceae bacterium]